MIHLEELVGRMGDLPALPDTVLRLMRVLNDPQSTVEQIVESIRYDQAITADVLRLCNSAYLGVPRTVISLNEAIRFLGLARILHLVMAKRCRGLLNSTQAGYGLAEGALWRHSVAVALASASLAARMELPDAQLAFTAGLLHDLGKLALSELVAADFAQIIECVTTQGIGFVEAEQQLLGYAHPEVGALLAEKWQLPTDVVLCIRYHHEPQAGPADAGALHAVHLANAVCRMLGIGVGAEELFCRADPVVMQRHSLTESDLEAVGADVLPELLAIEQAFGSAPAVVRSGQGVRSKE